MNGLIAGTSDQTMGTERDRGISATELGLRYHLLDNDGWRPLPPGNSVSLASLR